MGYGYRSAYGLGYNARIWKREAEAEPEPEADADAGLYYGGYAGYNGLAGYGFGLGYAARSYAAPAYGTPGLTPLPPHTATGLPTVSGPDTCGKYLQFHKSLPLPQNLSNQNSPSATKLR